MGLQAPDRCFRLRLGLGNVEIGGIGGIEPDPSVAVKDPVSPALGISQFGLECPAIDSPINELGGTVLSCGRYDLDARSQDCLLLPSGVFLKLHRWSTHKIHRQSSDAIEQPGAVDGPSRTKNFTAECSHTVWQSNGNVGRASEKVKRVKNTYRG